MGKPSSIDIVVELLKEMGIPERLIKVYDHKWHGVVHVGTDSEIREIKRETFPKSNSCKRTKTLISKYNLQMQIENGKEVEIFGIREKLLLHDPNFVEQFKDGIREALREKIDLKGLQEAKKLLDDYLEVFAPIIKGP